MGNDILYLTCELCLCLHYFSIRFILKIELISIFLIMNIVIMAGGGGTRLWPMSRESRPKQFSALASELTMFEETFNRFKVDFPINKIFIATNEAGAKIAQKILPEIPKKNYIIEPEKRDTGPAYAFACAHLCVHSDPNEPVAFIASDHYIKDTDNFRVCIKEADKEIKKSGKMVDIGIKPEFANETLGYVKIGKKIKKTNGIKFYEFLGQKEKPALEIAKKYVRSGKYLWHASFFMWTPRKFLEAYEKYAPGIYEPMHKVMQAMKKKDRKKIIAEFKKTEKTSIDYAVAEHIDQKKVLIIKGEFGWSDLGSWVTIYDQLKNKTDSQGNLIKANFVHKDTKKCLVYGHPEKIIATIGVDDLAIIDTKDALLICKKNRSQDVKKIIEILKEENRGEYL